ncbi:MAG: hypothetical protein KKA10_03775 [Euryarchaeota archaeon]|nr:hypothetical protein [Euryarchaeota archaeon]MCG2735618.1 hypothetical protein [Candidatus Methanoperedenaceae archaeon]
MLRIAITGAPGSGKSTMEFKSPDFIKAVREALESDKDMLVVLHRKSSHPVAE